MDQFPNLASNGTVYGYPYDAVMNSVTGTTQGALKEQCYTCESGHITILSSSY